MTDDQARSPVTDLKSRLCRYDSVLATLGPPPGTFRRVKPARLSILTGVIALGLAGPAAAQTVPAPTPAPTVTPAPTPAPPAPTIAAGITAGGIDLSGMTVEQAEAALAPLAAPATAPVIVAVAGKRYTLKTRKVKLAFDANRTARRALNASAKPPAAGTTKAVPLAIEFIRTPIRRFVKQVQRGAYQAPRDARVGIQVRRVTLSKGRKGRAVSGKKLNPAIEAALAHPAKPRLLKPGRFAVKPNVTTAEVRRANATVITVDQSEFTARLFKHRRVVKRYKVAVGQPAYPTPNGRFSVTSKQVNPTWNVPSSPWAGELQGSSVSGSDPSNPLKARWMGLAGGVGFHGTGEDYSVGTRASHGCLRMHVSDVIDLFNRTPLGTPVLIAP